MNRSLYARYAWVILLVAVALLPCSIWGALQAFRGSNNNISQWLPRDFPETERYLEFRRVFGAAVASARQTSHDLPCLAC